MSINVELLTKLYDWAVASKKGLDKFFEDNPQFAKHRQSAWGEAIKNGTCETAFCLAGQAAVNEGYTFIASKDDWSHYEGSSTFIQGGAMVPTAQVHNLGLHFVKGSGKTFAHGSRAAVDKIFDSGDYRYPASIAEEVMGITESEASRLFNGGNDLEDIESYINRIFERHGVENRVGEGVMAPDYLLD
jgi:hypothetical protein